MYCQPGLSPFQGDEDLSGTQRTVWRGEASAAGPIQPDRRPRRPLHERSAAELRAQAAEYRQMAQTARTMVAMKGLQNVAARFEALAEQMESCQRQDA